MFKALIHKLGVWFGSRCECGGTFYQTTKSINYDKSICDKCGKVSK